MAQYRTEKDSMGALKVPADALYAAQTQRAVNNFPISGLTMPPAFIRALGLIKGACAETNQELGLLPPSIARSILKATRSVAAGKHNSQFPIDVFQTGSGTSSNMNANEVIATLASGKRRGRVHPNDHVNMGQSSNDVIPTAIQVSACLTLHETLLPALQHLRATLETREKSLGGVVKTGRTHLMDAMPVTFSQELAAWRSQVESGIARLKDAGERCAKLPLGGTAVGTGINAHPRFGRLVAKRLSAHGVKFAAAKNPFEGISSQDASVELSGQLKTVAVSLMKLANDLRWMNSGPLAGLSEIELPALQPGSSIMPGKVNPVVPEAMAMVCAQVIGNDAAITVGGQSGNFQLNVMLPMIAYNLLQSIEILGNAARLMADRCIDGFRVNEDRVAEAVARNPILVTALNPVIGYEKGAAIAKQAYKEKRPVLDVAAESSGLSRRELRRLLDPKALTKGGIKG